VVLLNEPNFAEELAFEGMDIYLEIKERRQREEEEAKKALEEERKKPFDMQKKSKESQNEFIIIG
ncbi:MAG: hypothetical protein GX792_08885, partial [Bacteroidales bacterium]|nr:hypothetical protein [Bacteroidales bacterium]